MEVEVQAEEVGVDLFFRIGARKGGRDNRMTELFEVLGLIIIYENTAVLHLSEVTSLFV